MEPTPRSTIHDAFEHLSDPRTAGNLTHPLINLIAITICGVISGAESWTDLEEYGRAKRGFLSTFLDLSQGIPSHDTFGRVFRWIDPDELASCFHEWTALLSHLTEGEVVAVDGKYLRGSKDGRHGRGALGMVSAWAEQNHLVLAEEKVGDKSNEYTAIPRLLRLLDLKGCVVTIDAAGCYPTIAQQIIAQDADYLLVVKGNQDSLLADIELTFSDPHLMDYASYARQVDESHGRHVVRECWATSRPDILAHLTQDRAWPALQSIVRLTNRSGEGAHLTVQTRYFITSLPAHAPSLLRKVRRHWAIENSLHWVLDVAFREDDSRIRSDHAPENMALVRHLALNLLKHERSLKVGVKARSKRAGWDNRYLLKVLSVKV